MITRAIPAPTHGRYLVEVPSGSGPWPMVVGFHGYAEAADIQLERLRGLASGGAWLLVSVQGLHRFYRGRSQEVVAGWMTRQDRDLAIADNLAYVAAVVDAARREWMVGRAAFAGFSQGVAMAFRTAVHLARHASGFADSPVVACGGDVPPELDSRALAMIPAVLLGRGALDELYPSETFDSDVRRLRTAGVRVDAITIAGAHDWSDEFGAAAAAFLSKDDDRNSAGQAG